MKAKVVACDINREEMTEFLNTNKIIEFAIYRLEEKLMADDSFYGSLRSLKIDSCSQKFIDLKKFTSL